MRSHSLMALITAAVLILTGPSRAQDGGPFDLKRNMRALDHPFLEAGYGLALPTHKAVATAFAPAGLLEAKLGYTDILKRKGVLNLDEKFIYGSYMKSDYAVVSGDSGDIEAEMTRFGTGLRSGYGFPIWFMDLVPYNLFTFDLSRTTFTPAGPLPSADSVALARVEGAYRFGHSFEAGLQMRLFKSVSALVSFQGSVAFPRFVFPEWFGSYMVMAGSLVLISNFATDIVESSPIIGPVLYFVLRSGVAVAFYYALRDKMNWPFPSETPLAMETIRIGGSISF